MALLKVAPHRALAELETDLKLTSAVIASAMGVDKRAVARWQHSDIPNVQARRALGQLYELRERVLYTFGDGAGDWMHTPNEYLGELSPEEVLKAGRIDRVLGAIEAFDSGVYL
jgi:hypothetical protein